MRGTGVALVTPFTTQETIDWRSLEKLIDHVINGGVEYVVTLGTTGETPTLSAEEKLDLIKFTFEKVNKRVPVVVGIGDYNTKDVVKRLETCPLDEAAAVLSVAPYYSKPTQEGIYQHYKAIAAASPKPIILYNVPGRTGRNMTAETTLRIAKEVENVIAMKEASGDMLQCMEIIARKPKGFLVMFKNFTAPVFPSPRIHPSRIPLGAKSRHTVNAPVKIDSKLRILEPFRFSFNSGKGFPGFFKLDVGVWCSCVGLCLTGNKRRDCA